MPKASFPDKLEFLFEPHRYKIAYGGRGGAKSWGFARALLIEGARRPLRILCARETQKSIADSVHRLLSDQIKELGLQAVYSVQAATINAINGTEIIFAGLRHNVNNIKSVEAADVVWVEEAQNVSRDSWEVLIPTIRKENSEIWVSFNPDLETDDTYKRFVLSPPPGAFVQKITYRDNPWFPEVLRVEMEHLRDTNLGAYEHVYEGSCKSSVEGAIFAAEMKKATEEGRIGNVPYNKTKPVDTIWDLGFSDLTTVWFVQPYSGYFNFIDYLQGEGLTIADYVVKLQNKGYVYGTDWLPHDGIDTIIHRRLSGGDRTMSIDMLMRGAGRNVQIVPKLYVADGINAARTIFPQCRFDAEKCADGLQALRHYQWGPVNERGVRSAEPLHNWASHASDAFRGAAVALKQPEREERRISSPPRMWSSSKSKADSWMQ
jgi:phage terminase large subunit